MIDDIDDLLDEVESKYCRDGKKDKNSSKCFGNPSKSKLDTKKSKGSKDASFTDDITRAIDDIMADDDLDVKLENTVEASHKSTKQMSLNNGQLKLKCNPVYIGGSTSKLGVSSSTNLQCCDRLHCTSCDNQIVFFDAMKWDEEHCDYLAFRNNYPDYKRLKYLFIPRKGYRAYCCQCSWLSNKDITMLRSIKPNFKWVCKKH